MARRILLVKGHNGLGNRLLSLATAHYYGQLSDRRLLVDWRDRFYSADGQERFRQLFISPDAESIEAVEADSWSRESITPPVWVGHGEDEVITRVMALRPGAAWALMAPDLWRHCSVDLCRMDHPEDTAVIWMNFERIQPLRRHFRGEFAALAHRSDRTLLRSWLRERLRPQPWILQRVDAFRQARLGESAVGVHVRYTDKKTNLVRLQQRVDALLSSRRDRPILVATDSQEVLDQFRRRYARVEALPKRHSRDGRRLHLSRRGDDQCRQDAEDAVVDLYLLAGCRELVYDESSSFGHVASLLSSASDRHQHNVYTGRHLPRPLRQKLFVWLRLLRLLPHRFR